MRQLFQRQRNRLGGCASIGMAVLGKGVSGTAPANPDPITMQDYLDLYGAGKGNFMLDSLKFSNFDFGAGTSGLKAADIDVTQVSGANGFGLTFAVSLMVDNALTSKNLSIGFNVMATDPNKLIN